MQGYLRDQRQNPREGLVFSSHCQARVLGVLDLANWYSQLC